MAQKLTEQEHDAIVSLAKLLSKELPVQQRSVSGGIASGLVRLRKNPLGREDVMGVLTKYGAGEPTLKDLLDLHVLEREKGGEGYVLLTGGTSTLGPAKHTSSKDEKNARSEARPESRAQAIARAERPKPPARRPARRLPSSKTSAGRSSTSTLACGSTAGCSAPPRHTSASSASSARSTPRLPGPPPSATAPSARASSPTASSVTRSSWR